jgi:hypothetical protein
MGGSRYSIMKKLIIAIGIIAAILAVLISFKAKSQLQVIGRALNFRTEISIKFDEENHINWN